MLFVFNFFLSVFNPSICSFPPLTQLFIPSVNTSVHSSTDPNNPSIYRPISSCTHPLIHPSVQASIHLPFLSIILSPSFIRSLLSFIPGSALKSFHSSVLFSLYILPSSISFLPIFHSPLLSALQPAIFLPSYPPSFPSFFSYPSFPLSIHRAAFRRLSLFE